MGPHRPWTPADQEKLDKMWGNYTIPVIANRLGRTERAIEIYARKKGYESAVHSREDISMPELATAAGVDYKTVRNWEKNHELPTRTVKPAGKKKYKFINLRKFWKWAEQHKDNIDFSKMERLTLGQEPEWVAAERKRDFMDKEYKGQEVKWTEKEEQKLINLLKLSIHGHAELAEMFNRTELGIRKKIQNMKRSGLIPKYMGPVPVEMKRWTPEEMEVLKVFIAERMPINVMAKELGRTELQVRGKIDRLKNPQRDTMEYRRNHAGGEAYASTMGM